MKFCHISSHFLVRGLCSELPVKYVFGNILRILSSAGTPIVRIFYRTLYVKLTADSQCSFIIGLYVMITFQIIPDPPGFLDRGIFVDLFYFICYPLVFQLTFRCLSTMKSFIIHHMGNSPKLTQVPDGIAEIFVFLFDRPVYGFMSDQVQPCILSISSSFFRRISPFLPVAVLPWHAAFRVRSFPLRMFFFSAVLQGTYTSRFVFYGVISGLLVRYSIFF